MTYIKDMCSTRRLAHLLYSIELASQKALFFFHTLVVESQALFDQRIQTDYKLAHDPF